MNTFSLQDENNLKHLAKSNHNFFSLYWTDLNQVKDFLTTFKDWKKWQTTSGFWHKDLPIAYLESTHYLEPNSKLTISPIEVFSLMLQYGLKLDDDCFSRRHVTYKGSGQYTSPYKKGNDMNLPTYKKEQVGFFIIDNFPIDVAISFFEIAFKQDFSFTQNYFQQIDWKKQPNQELKQRVSILMEREILKQTTNNNSTSKKTLL